MTIEFSGAGPNSGVVHVTLETEDAAAFDDQPMPKKLGDGNFGAVFAAESSNAQLAMKVIYAHQAPEIVSEDVLQTGFTDIAEAISYKNARVNEELTVGEKIYQRLAERKSEHAEFAFLLNNFAQHLVLPKYYTFELDKAKDFQVFAKRFKAADVEFSKFAYVMDRFECSLKDLMDYGGRKTDDEDAISGYSRLAKVPMRERERSAIPVLKQVAAGLRVLHAAGFRHQDIKPANVYFKRNAVLNVEFKLGDLGFLNPRPTAVAGSAMASTESLAIGTKHYRSVEQIDFSDTSEVTVRPLKGEKLAAVTSSDPKFAHTNIAAGDLVVFPRSASKRQFEIKTFEVLESDDRNPSNAKTVRIEIPTDGVNEGTILEEDLTQATFIKNPTARTDLFGLGALLFDILTAGDSPERFYDLLRKFDVKGTSIESSVLNYYENWIAEQHIDSDIAAIFHRVTGAADRDNVSIDVLTFLLRCCASDCEDSFYHKFKFDEPFQDGVKTPWELLGEELVTVEEAIGAKAYDNVNVNALTAETPPDPGVYTPKPSDRARNVLDLLKTLSDIGVENSDDARNRWLRGVSFLSEALTHLHRVHGQLSDPHVPDGTAYISLAPQHTGIGRLNHSLTYSERYAEVPWSEFWQKLRSLDSLVCSLELHQSMYQPIWWPSRMRRVKLDLITNDAPEEEQDKGPESADATDSTMDEVDENEAEDGATHDRSLEAPEEEPTLLEFRVRYSGFTQAWKSIAPGDYVILTEAKTSKAVFEVIEHAKQIVAVERRDTNSSNGDNLNLSVIRDSSGYVIKQFEPIDYLAGMYAIYMFHALFYTTDTVGVTDFGNAVSAQAVGFPVGDNLRRPSEYSAENAPSAMSVLGMFKGTSKSDAPFQAIAKQTCALCVWLMLGGYHSEDGQDAQLRIITDEIDAWKETVFAHLGLNRTDFARIAYSVNGDIEQIVLDKVKDDIGWRTVTGGDWRAMVDDYLKGDSRDR